MPESRRLLRRIKPEPAEDMLEIEVETDETGVPQVTKCKRRDYDSKTTRVVKCERSHAPNTQRRQSEVKDEDTTVVKREQDDVGMSILDARMPVDIGLRQSGKELN